MEEEEQGFRLAPSEYLNTIRQVDKEFRGISLRLIVIMIIIINNHVECHNHY